MKPDDPPIPPALVLEREPTWAGELDEAIFAGQAAALPAAAKAFQPETLEQAEWCMTRLRALQDRAREIEVQAGAWADRVQHWRQAELGRIAPGVEFFEGRLEGYALRARAADPRRKTVSLPSGDIGTQQPKKPKVEIVNEEGLLEWLMEEVPGEVYEEVVETKARVKVVEFRKVAEAQQTLLPWCQQCGEQLNEKGDHGRGGDACPNDPDGIHHVECGCDRYDHDPEPGPGYEVLLGGKVVPGVTATLAPVTASVRPAR